MTTQAVIRSLEESFPYVRSFSSVEGWGMHLLASVEPMEQLDAGQLVARMPENAKKDLLEWSRYTNLTSYLELVVSHETPVKSALNPNPEIQITDDHPFNEYFLLREWGLFWR